jgi:hypothetical protein
MHHQDMYKFAYQKLGSQYFETDTYKEIIARNEEPTEEEIEARERELYGQLSKGTKVRHPISEELGIVLDTEWDGTWWITIQWKNQVTTMLQSSLLLEDYRKVAYLK